MTLAHRFISSEPTICPICRRQAIWCGYGPYDSTRSIMWSCGDLGCTNILRKFYHMSDQRLTGYEDACIREAGDQAGQFLDSIGKTDLAQLSAEEWMHFLRIFLEQFGETMKRKITEGEAPF